MLVIRIGSTTALRKSQSLSWAHEQTCKRKPCHIEYGVSQLEKFQEVAEKSAMKCRTNMLPPSTKSLIHESLPYKIHRSTVSDYALASTSTWDQKVFTLSPTQEKRRKQNRDQNRRAKPTLTEDKWQICELAGVLRQFLLLPNRSFYLASGSFAGLLTLLFASTLLAKPWHVIRRSDNETNTMPMTNKLEKKQYGWSNNAQAWSYEVMLDLI